MPALGQARRNLASSLMQLEVMSQRVHAKEDAALGGSSEFGRNVTAGRDFTAGLEATGGRRALLDASQDAVTLAQIMSILSNLNTLNVSPLWTEI